jgi:Ca2+-binding RTX toxin-like protein
MSMTRTWKVGMAGAALSVTFLLAMLVSASPTPADTTSPTWTCRASFGYVALGSADRIEPVLANGNPQVSTQSPDRDQCVDDIGALLPTVDLGDAASLRVLAQSPYARTDTVCVGTSGVGNPPCENGNIGPARNSSVLSNAGTTDPVQIVLGGESGIVVTVQTLRSSASATCRSGVPALDGQSTVVNVTVTLGGQEIPIEPISGEPNQVIDISPLIKITFNELITEGTATSADQSLTRRALNVQVLPSETEPAGINAVLGETKVDRHGAVCAPASNEGSGTGGAGDSSTRPCPQGSVYEPQNNLCVINDRVSSTQTVRIVVGRPYQGPSGGSVISLRVARQRYNSPCLSGSSPRYVIIGTNRADRITGTNRADRILLFGGRDNSEGGRGNDCIDGGTGPDTISGALGVDRLYGGSGNDHLIGGSNSDRLSAGSGNDTVNTGYGKDRVTGGSGRDFINASTAGPASARLDCGGGADKVRINRNERRRVRGCETVYFLR